jgi:hypothetical protein
MSFKQPPELHELQSDVLGASLVDNPHLPASPIPAKNKALNTGKTYITGAINELLQTIENIRNLVGTSLSQQQAVLGDFVSAPELLRKLQKVDASVLEAIVKLAKEIAGDLDQPQDISAIAPNIKEAILKLSAAIEKPESVYDIWLELGNTGTKAEFLSSLKGKKGPDGKDGVSSPPGGTAEQVLVKVSNEDYAAAWQDLPEQVFIAGYKNMILPPGRHLIECYGAQGGGFNGRSDCVYIVLSSTVYEPFIVPHNLVGGLGGYSKGILDLKQSIEIFVYVGASGRDRFYPSNWNGSGNSRSSTSCNGGGATDIRLVGGPWSDVTSLRSRIMVAGAGGGAISYYNCLQTIKPPGAGGGLEGGSGGVSIFTYGRNYESLIEPETIPLPQGGRQIAGDGSGFGVESGPLYYTTGLGGSGGGGGYYVGAGGKNNDSSMNYRTQDRQRYTVYSGAGGSSFISGMAGCDAIDKEGNHTGQPNHYSGLVFTECEMKSGVHTGHGLVRITLNYDPDTQTDDTEQNKVIEIR